MSVKRSCVVSSVADSHHVSAELAGESASSAESQVSPEMAAVSEAAVRYSGARVRPIVVSAQPEPVPMVRKCVEEPTVSSVISA